MHTAVMVGRVKPLWWTNFQNNESTLATVKKPTAKCSKCRMEHRQDYCPKSECNSKHALITTAAP